jgi:excisionase family DNA binding protein
MSNVPQQSGENNPSSNSDVSIPPEVVEAIRQALREELPDLMRKRSAGVKPLLSIGEVADILGLCVRSVRDLIALGKLQSADVGPKGGKTKVTPAALDAYIERCAR